MESIDIPKKVRTASTLLRQWEKISAVKSQLVKQGLLDGDATPAQVLEKLRQLLPADIMS